VTARLPIEFYRQPIWMPVVGFEGSYEVSDTGLVRSLDRISVYTRRDHYSGRILEISRHHRGRLLAPAPSLSGHLSVALGRGNTKAVHLIVLEAFVGPCPEGCECLHRNNRPDDNRLENLRWGTRSENIVDAIEHGAMPRGSRKWNAKLSERQIPLIREMMPASSYAQIGRIFGVSEATIRQVRDRRTWRHVQ
jgi:hypothetical protein